MLDVMSSLTKRIRKLRRAAKAAEQSGDKAPLTKGEGFKPDGSFLSIHPTKGFRRIGPKRLAAYSSN